MLVAWADEEEVPALSGDVAGLAGSVVVESLGRARYVTGTVTLDAEAFQRITGELGGDAAAQAIIDHEFGHLVGLDHVDDAGELMYADNIGRRDWGPGDLAGLSRLGRGTLRLSAVAAPCRQVSRRAIRSPMSPAKTTAVTSATITSVSSAIRIVRSRAARSRSADRPADDPQRARR